MTMRMGLFARTALVLLLLAVAVAPGLAEAQAPLRSEIPAETLIEAARVALAQGELDDAELLLEGVEPSDEHIDDLDFLYGTIALARGDWETTAVARFRAMLSRDPTLVRVSARSRARLFPGEAGRPRGVPLPPGAGRPGSACPPPATTP